MCYGVRHVAIRPEEVVLQSQAEFFHKENTFAGLVKDVHEYGFFAEVQVAVHQVVFRAALSKKNLLEQGIREREPVTVSFDPTSVHTL